MNTLEFIVTILSCVLGSGTITAVVTWLLTRIDKKGALNNAVRMSLLINLQGFGKEIVNRGYCSSLEYNQFCDAYEAYKALDGDGYADSLMAAIEKVNKNSIEGGLL